ncbi:MAG: DUF447 family protein [Candidatus Lokiarchaeota archaeon]|nr:DUF447 family protein [Candidatus Lokiarchaeota archaeon]
MCNYQDFGLKRDNLYEVIVTTYSNIEESKEIRPHASCMGIRLIEEGQIQISPFYSTITYKNLKNFSVIMINFVDNVYLYALAALKEQNSPIGLTNFPSKYYSFKHLESLAMDVPFITKSWGIMVGKVSHEFQKTKKDDLGEVMIPVFKLDIIFSERFRESNKLFNRAENLALEAVILATRLKIAKQNKDKTQFMKIHSKILDYIENIERFGKNKNALKVIELINDYVSKLKI